MCETAVEYRSVCRCIPKNKTVDSDNPKLNVLLLHSARAHRKSVNAASPVAFMAFIAFIAWHESRGRVRTQQTADWRNKQWNSAYLLQYGAAIQTSWILDVQFSWFGYGLGQYAFLSMILKPGFLNFHLLKCCGLYPLVAGTLKKDPSFLSDSLPSA